MTYSEEQILDDVAGASDVVAWFGRWPSFHDGEVVSLSLNREVASVLKVHAFNTSSELTKSGHYKTDKHALVVFYLTNILAMNIADFNSQNVLSALVLSKTGNGFLIELGCCYGPRACSRRSAGPRSSYRGSGDGDPPAQRIRHGRCRE